MISSCSAGVKKVQAGQGGHIGGSELPFGCTSMALGLMFGEALELALAFREAFDLAFGELFSSSPVNIASSSVSDISMR